MARVNGVDWEAVRRWAPVEPAHFAPVSLDGDASRFVIPGDVSILGCAWAGRSGWLAAAPGGRVPEADGRVLLVAAHRGQAWAARGHEAGVFSVAFDPAAQVLATTSFDGTVRLWHLPRKEVAVVPTGSQRVPHRAVFAQGGRWLVVGDEVPPRGGRSALRVFDLADGALVAVRNLPVDWFVEQVVPSPGGRTLFVAVAPAWGREPTGVMAWNVGDKRPVWEAALEARALLHGLAPAPGGLVISVTLPGEERHLRLHDRETGEAGHGVHLGRGFMGALGVDGDLVAAAGSDRRLDLLRLPALRPVDWMPLLHPVMSLALTATGKRVALGTAEGPLVVRAVPV